MKLENLNLSELNAQELQEINGGRGWAQWVIAVADNWGDIKEGLRAGFNQHW